MKSLLARLHESVGGGDGGTQPAEGAGTATPTAAPACAAAGSGIEAPRPKPTLSLRKLAVRALLQEREQEAAAAGDEDAVAGKPSRLLRPSVFGSRLQDAVRLMRTVNAAEKTEQLMADHQSKITEHARSLAAARKRLKQVDAALAADPGSGSVDLRVERATLIADVHALDEARETLQHEAAELHARCAMSDDDMAAFRHYKAVKHLRERRREEHDAAQQRKRNQALRQKEAMKFSERQEHEKAVHASAKAKYKQMQALAKERAEEHAALKQRIAEVKKEIAEGEGELKAIAAASLRAIDLRATLIALKQDLDNTHTRLRGLAAHYEELAPSLSVAEKRIVKTLQAGTARREKQLRAQQEEDDARRAREAAAAEAAAAQAHLPAPRELRRWKLEFGEQVQLHYDVAWRAIEHVRGMLAGWLAACSAVSGAQWVADPDRLHSLLPLAGDLWAALTQLDKMAHTLAARAADDMQLAQLSPAEASAEADGVARQHLSCLVADDTRDGAAEAVSTPSRSRSPPTLGRPHGPGDAAAAASTPTAGTGGASPGGVGSPRSSWRKTMSVLSLGLQKSSSGAGTASAAAVPSCEASLADTHDANEPSPSPPPARLRRAFDPGTFLHELRDLEARAVGEGEGLVVDGGRGHAAVETTTATATATTHTSKHSPQGFSFMNGHPRPRGTTTAGPDTTVTTLFYLQTGLRPVAHVAGLKQRLLHARHAKAQAKAKVGEVLPSPMARAWLGSARSTMYWYFPNQYRQRVYDDLTARAARVLGLPSGEGRLRAVLVCAVAGCVAGAAACGGDGVTPRRRTAFFSDASADGYIYASPSPSHSPHGSRWSSRSPSLANSPRSEAGGRRCTVGGRAASPLTSTRGTHDTTPVFQRSRSRPGFSMKHRSTSSAQLLSTKRLSGFFAPRLIGPSAGGTAASRENSPPTDAIDPFASWTRVSAAVGEELAAAVADGDGGKDGLPPRATAAAVAAALITLAAACSTQVGPVEWPLPTAAEALHAAMRKGGAGGSPLSAATPHTTLCAYTNDALFLGVGGRRSASPLARASPMKRHRDRRRHRRAPTPSPTTGTTNAPAAAAVNGAAPDDACGGALAERLAAHRPRPLVLWEAAAAAAAEQAGRDPQQTPADPNADGSAGGSCGWSDADGDGDGDTTVKEDTTTAPTDVEGDAAAVVGERPVQRRAPLTRSRSRSRSKPKKNKKLTTMKGGGAVFKAGRGVHHAYTGYVSPGCAAADTVARARRFYDVPLARQPVGLASSHFSTGLQAQTLYDAALRRVRQGDRVVGDGSSRGQRQLPQQRPATAPSRV